MGTMPVVVVVMAVVVMGAWSLQDVPTARWPVVPVWHILEMRKELTLHLWPRKEAPLGDRCQVCRVNPNLNPNLNSNLTANCTYNSTDLHINPSASIHVGFTCPEPEKHFAMNASLKYLFNPKHLGQVSMRVPMLPRTFPLSLVEVKWKLMLSTKGEEGSLEILFPTPRPSTIKPPSQRPPGVAGGSDQAGPCDEGELHIFTSDWVAQVMTVGSFCQHGAGKEGGLQKLLSRNGTSVRLLLPPKSRAKRSPYPSAVEFSVSYLAQEIQDQYIVFYELGRNGSEVVQSAGWPRGVPDLMSGSWLVSTVAVKSRSIPDYATRVTFLNASAPKCRQGHVTMAVEPFTSAQPRHSLNEGKSWREDDAWPQLVGLSSDTFYLNFSNCKVESGSLLFKALIEPGVKPPPDSKALMIGGIAGGVVASVLLIVLVTVCCVCKKRRRKPPNTNDAGGDGGFRGQYEGFVPRGMQSGRTRKASDSSIYEVIPDEAVYSFHKAKDKNPPTPNGQEQVLTENEFYRAFHHLSPPPLPSRNTPSTSMEMVAYDLPPTDDHEDDHEDDRVEEEERGRQKQQLRPGEPLLNQVGIPKATDEEAVQK
ncbi:uncharacterized protein LOC133340302 isoform X2 [Lethenteron reissneri]|uniref:uncharacterized protein LOC133340302 isoform X2 n=1 Tax=Lethenteron reissneri TaxID=7753 RepID=UPI002AB60902|nr:uncharacterized protein LOC133340302 isoform X2 [Lethenteron reissneri]